MVFRKDIEELVCLQLIGLSPKQILEMNKNKVYDIISHAENTYKKATQIIKEQVEAGVEMISYYDENYPKHFKENLGNDAPPLLHLRGTLICSPGKIALRLLVQEKQINKDAKRLINWPTITQRRDIRLSVDWP